jgi:hypothetical protein
VVLLFFLLVLPVFAQEDFESIRKLDESLPTYSEQVISDDEIKFNRETRNFSPPIKIISMEKILGSGTQMGAISSGSPIRNIESNSNHHVSKLFYVKYFNLEDENGFKYIQNNDGTVSWKILSRYVAPIKEEIALYVPPLRYTPAPKNIVRTEYDYKLSILPELSLYTGVVQGDYMQDLFDDNKARSGLSNQYGIHFFTQWNLPIKAGAVLHYEKTTYRLSDGGEVLYTAPSFGPQFKTKDFELFDNPVRFQTQFRISPLARATTRTDSGSVTFKFNSADLLASLDRPFKNRYGEFILGLYLQSQWLNIKDQSQFVNVKPSNRTNRSIGLSFSQVFQ